jgi:hypothetical protein
MLVLKKMLAHKVCPVTHIILTIGPAETTMKRKEKGRASTYHPTMQSPESYIPK